MNVRMHYMNGIGLNMSKNDLLTLLNQTVEIKNPVIREAKNWYKHKLQMLLRKVNN